MSDWIDFYGPGFDTFIRLLFAGVVLLLMLGSFGAGLAAGVWFF